jgi:hypothetical protein
MPRSLNTATATDRACSSARGVARSGRPARTARSRSGGVLVGVGILDADNGQVEFAIVHIADIIAAGANANRESSMFNNCVMRAVLYLAALLLMVVPGSANAAVTITFWSHEFSGDFPHAFFTLRGTIDANGAPVDTNFGFTAKAATPAVLFGTVPGRLDIAKPGYMAASDAQFSLVLTDAQYADILALVAAWDPKTGDGHYNLNGRNCVHFVQDAARRLGLAGVDHPKLMKRPRSYLDAVEAANLGRVTPVNMHGKEYLAHLAPIPTAIEPTTRSVNARRPRRPQPHHGLNWPQKHPRQAGDDAREARLSMVPLETSRP